MIEDWEEFGLRKKNQLRSLRRMYTQLGKPSGFEDMLRLGRINSSAELLRMTREAREELKARSSTPVEAPRFPLRIPLLLRRSLEQAQSKL